MNGILAVGDCIMLGVEHCLQNSYPEKIAARLGVPVLNKGLAMATSREGRHLLSHNVSRDYDCIFLQFGLADAYFTFKYAPYIPYYPDNFFRKQLRSIVKKYKKTCRKMGLNDRYGQVQVVPVAEYRENFLSMINRCGDRVVILPETIPHHETYRNEAIQRYNRELKTIAEAKSNCHLIALFDDFLPHFSDFYLDQGHPNDKGYDHIADKITAYLIDNHLATPHLPKTTSGKPIETG